MEEKKKYKLYRPSQAITAMDYGSARLLTSDRYKFSMFYGMKSLPTEEEWINEIQTFLHSIREKAENKEHAAYVLTAQVGLIRATADKILRDYCE